MFTDLRKVLWNYPEKVLSIARFLKPIPIILFVALLTFGFYSYSVKYLYDAHKGRNSFTEGVVGNLTGTNPIFTTYNPVDRGLFNLIFLKFIYLDENGNPTPGIASSWEISNNGLEYIFKLNRGLKWSDGEKITADDVVYTFRTAIDLAKNNSRDTIGTPFSDVKIEKISEDTVKFTLKQKNASFLELVSTYIIPKHVFSLITPNRLTRYFPFGKVVSSGKYKVVSIRNDRVVLKASKPSYHIQTLTFRFFDNDDSLEKSFRNFELDAIYSFDKQKYPFIYEYNTYKKVVKPLDYRIRLIYFNLRNPKLSSPALRNALVLITNKKKILKDSGLDEEPIKSSIPEKSWAFNPDISYPTFNPKKAQTVFTDANFVKNKTNGLYESTDDKKLLTLTLTYLDNDVNNRLAKALQENWKEEGVILKLNPVSYEQITKEILPTRDFELLLYQVELTEDPDQYDLWHSLKKDYPALNISGYDFARSDILLERARTELDKGKRKKDYYTFQKYLIADMPVMFLSKVNFVYIYNKNLQGLDLEHINYPYERFNNIENWYWK